jgi:hypothetical protein
MKTEADAVSETLRFLLRITGFMNFVYGPEFWMSSYLEFRPMAKIHKPSDSSESLEI